MHDLAASHGVLLFLKPDLVSLISPLTPTVVSSCSPTELQAQRIPMRRHCKPAEPHSCDHKPRSSFSSFRFITVVIVGKKVKQGNFHLVDSQFSLILKWLFVWLSQRAGTCLCWEGGVTVRGFMAVCSGLAAKYNCGLRVLAYFHIMLLNGSTLQRN